MSSINLTRNESENKRALSFLLKFNRRESFHSPPLADNSQSRSVQFFFAPARILNVRFRKNQSYFHRCFVCFCSGSCRGNTEQVVAQWRHPVTSGVALDMLHWAMLHVSLQRLGMAIKMACNKGAFVCCCHLFCLA